VETHLPVEPLPRLGEISCMSWSGLLTTLTGRALINPRVAADLLRVAWRFRHRHWYRRFPFLPLPAMGYLRWRLYTAYGDENIAPPADDVIAFAHWVGRQP
jgi:hypothetical protein